MVIGIDEVGRGCWAGPMAAAAVILDHNFTISKAGSWKLRDSKRLSKRQREVAAGEIVKIAQVGLGWVWPDEIDTLGLTEANALVMLRAIKQIDYVGADKIIIDGNINYLQSRLCRVTPCSKDGPCKECSKLETRVGADSHVPAVSAASIVAKVARDRYMSDQAKLFPDYGFDKHVGYGTKLHLAQLQKFGVTPLHRRSYKPIATLL